METQLRGSGTRGSVCLRVRALYNLAIYIYSFMTDSQMKSPYLIYYKYSGIYYLLQIERGDVGAQEERFSNQ